MANLNLTNEQLYNLWKILTLNMFIGLECDDPTLSELGSLSRDLLLPINEEIAKLQKERRVKNERDRY